MLEHKFCPAGSGPLTGLRLGEGLRIEGYASLFDLCDQGGDVVRPGAYGASLARLKARGGRVRMLWQHDVTRPIGLWEEVSEDQRGLRVKGRLLEAVAQGREAAALLEAGAIDGLSIGYRTLRAGRDEKGRRLLEELELWEVSLVTFPMLGEARAAAQPEGKSSGPEAALAGLTGLFDGARAELAARRRPLREGQQ